jgi:hypothetical protein
MQALPLAGVLADRYFPSKAVPFIGLACAVGLTVVVATYMQAVGGRPFI